MEGGVWVRLRHRIVIVWLGTGGIREQGVYGYGRDGDCSRGMAKNRIKIEA